MIDVSYFRGRSILHGTCAMSGYFDFLTFSPENMTFTLTNVSWSLHRIYKWQVTHTFRAYQPNMGLVLCYFYPLTFVLEIMTLHFEILFANSCSAQLKGIQCQYLLIITIKSDVKTSQKILDYLINENIFPLKVSSLT